MDTQIILQSGYCIVSVSVNNEDVILTSLCSEMWCCACSLTLMWSTPRSWANTIKNDNLFYITNKINVYNNYLALQYTHTYILHIYLSPNIHKTLQLYIACVLQFCHIHIAKILAMENFDELLKIIHQYNTQPKSQLCFFDLTLIKKLCCTVSV